MIKHQRFSLQLPLWRAYFVAAVLGFFLLLLLLFFVYLQVEKQEDYRKQGESRYNRTIRLPAARGMITDRNGMLLAGSTPVTTIWVNPLEIAQSAAPIPYNPDPKFKPLPRKRPMTQAEFKFVAKVVGITEAELQSKLSEKNQRGNLKSYVYLRRQMAPQVARELLDLKITGVYAEQELKRFYPEAEVTAHLIGGTGLDGRGQEGFEKAMDEALSGVAGERHVVRDAKGHNIDDIGTLKKQQDGQNLTLSIDSKLQYIAYRELNKAVEKHKAKAGAIVMLDAKTGEVLALANVPTYNPNSNVGIDPNNRRNRVLTDTYEPGSTMKPFAAAIAIQSGKFKPTTIVNVNGGSIRFGSAVIHDTHSHGSLTVEQIIQVSSNVGAAKLALSFKPEEYWTFLDSVGFGKRTDSGFPGEVRGILRPWKKWVPVDQATMSFGHGIAVTVLQLARAYTIFTSNGELKPLSLLRQDSVPVGTPILSPQTAKAMRLMMEKVTLPGGTAQQARVAGYRVGGKTGTAHKVAGRGYAANRYVGSFVGFAPVSNPRIIVAVMIDEPTTGGYYGGVVAAPVFSKVVKDALKQMGVQPDAPLSNLLQPDKPEAGTEVF